MGCSNSKDAGVIEVDDRRRSRAKLKLELIQLRQDEPLQMPLKFPGKTTSLPRSLGLTPAVTPAHAEEGPDSLPLAVSAHCPSVSSKRSESISGCVPTSYGDRGAISSYSYRKNPASWGGATCELSAESEVSAGELTEGDTESESASSEIAENERASAAAAGSARRNYDPSIISTEERCAAAVLASAGEIATLATPEQQTPPGDATKPVQAATLHPEPPLPSGMQLFLEKHRPPEKEASLPDGKTIADVAVSPPPGVHKNAAIIISDGVTHEERQPRRPGGLPHGWASVTLPDGVVYEGSWSKGCVHGKGTLRLPNGNSYWGSWAYGRKHGLGTFSWADGSRYDGHYLAGKKNGTGTLRYASGATFEGDFLADLRHGVGRLELPSGVSYDGDWARGVPHGHGVFVDPTEGGERFEGSWRRGVRSGGGRLVQGWAEEKGARRKGEEACGDAEGGGEGFGGGAAWYSGNFEAGLPHGCGMMGFGLATFCGHVERGQWTGGGGKIDLGNGNGSFEGAWLGGLPRGRGRWRCNQSGIRADCTFKEGYCKQIWPS